MRLICGLVRLDGAAADPADLDRMAAALGAPGLAPAVARRVDGPAALALLDFGGPAMLPIGEDGTWLAADLRLDDPAADVLDAFAHWDADLPDKLHGDYALAAWTPERRRLRLARDFAGSRPLCYAHLPGRLFAFASLPRGLHASGLVPARPDLAALARVVTERFSANATGYEAIHWLPAGHSLELLPQGPRLHRAWRPDPAGVGTWRGSAAEAAAVLRDLVEAAVACRLPAAGPIATHLSGGLDSSAVAVIAARRLRAEDRGLHAFSFLSGDPDIEDERDFVAAVLAQEPDIRWTALHLPSFDQPWPADPDLPLGPQAMPELAVCSAAAAAGAGLVLSGAGGDEGATYNGAQIHASLLLQGRWRSLPASLRARARRQGRSLAGVAAERLLRPLVPEWLRRKPRPAGREEEFLVPALRGAAPPERRWNRPAERIRNWGADGYIPGRANQWAILGARHGVAFTYPLLDRRIVDFTLSLPLELFVHGGWTRQPFRDAMAGILPDPVRWRDSKYVPFPDLPQRLVQAKPALLARVEALRGVPAVAAFAELDAVAAALAGIPATAEGWERGVTLQGQAAAPLRRVMDGFRALIVAEHVARLG